MKRLIVLCGAVLAFGCAHPSPHENLPTYAWTDDPTALRELSARAHSIRTISAAALLTLTRPDGQSVRLDGALAISLPDKSVRLRTWKLSQAVFDLTLTPAGLWLETPKDAAGRGQIALAGLNAAQFARAMSIFGGEVFDGPGVQLIDHGGPRFDVRKSLDEGKSMTADVERSTLAVRQYRVTDSTGVVRLRLTLRDYGLFNGIAWPTRLIAKSVSGTIDVQLRDVEINADLPPGAFVPPRGAEKAP